VEGFRCKLEQCYSLENSLNKRGGLSRPDGGSHRKSSGGSPVRKTKVGVADRRSYITKKFLTTTEEEVREGKKEMWGEDPMSVKPRWCVSWGGRNARREEEVRGVGGAIME